MSISKILSYDYYILSGQKWCSLEYMIHGLWPNNLDGTYPKNCNGPDYIEMPELSAKLKKYWYDCNEEKSNYLWKHEWEKHGKCVYQQNRIEQKKYFIQALDLFQEFYKNENICFDLNFMIIECPKN